MIQLGAGKDNLACVSKAGATAVDWLSEGAILMF